MNDISSIRDYLQQIIGIRIEAKAVDRRELDKLPLFLRSSYEYHHVSILDKDVIFSVIRGKDKPSPDQLKKQEEKLRHSFSKSIVFVFEWLEAYQRKRLVQKKIPFMVPGKQLYVPFIFIDLNETVGKPKEPSEKLRPASQCLLLYHLEVKDLEGLSFQDIASRLHYSNMTISRAAKELEELGFVDIVGSKEKNLSFSKNRKELWNLCQNLLLSPIKRKFFVSQLPKDVNLYTSDLAALELYSNLAGGVHQTYAVGEDAYRLLKKRRKLEDMNLSDGKYSLEVWSYEPSLLTNTNIVDPLSLYLSMREVKDERVEMALEELIEQVGW